MFASILSFHNQRNLSIVQLATARQDTFQYMSSSKAIKENLVEVKQVSDGGSVNALIVLNKSGFFVFMMDGDILAGAKQNRVVNTSILLAPMSRTMIPVSCVEQGRWSRVSDRFSGTPYSAPASLRADKARRVTENLARKQGHASNQHEVWEGVEHYRMVACVDSPTFNLSDVFDHKAGELDGFIGHCEPDPNANGLAVFIDHNLLSMDAFNRKDIYLEYFPKILRGVALEAFYMNKPAGEMKEAEAKFRTLDFLDRYDTLEFTYHSGVAAGSERRFDCGELTGFELCYQDEMIHLAALRTRTVRKDPA